MKKIKRALSLVLVFCMLCTMTVTGFAADTTSEGQTDFMKIVHLDAGRKYFSVDSIKKIIDNASADGYNYLELAVGNDGLRFLLDDMSVTVDDKTYDSSAVSQAIHAGNEAYYNFDTDELTQTEMDTIIAYANEKGISIIPLINSPGHMDAILSAANSLTSTTCSYNGSARTIDVTNATAVAFTQALIQKYVTYFADKGCKYFNMGADEYANDIYTSGSMGFGNLQSTGKYGSFVTYVNNMATMIRNAGMTPMAFNDGIYFNNDTSSGEFDTDIVISYWSKGWNGYTPMSASDLASKGFKLINTHGDYYWVLGKSDAQCTAEKASGFNYKEFQGSTIDNPVGAMFCIWCDYPGADTEANVVSKTADTMAAFAKTLPSASDSSDSSDSSSKAEPSKAPAASEVPSDALTDTSLTMEYWITNRPVTANKATSQTITTGTAGIATEAGAKLSDIAPSTGTQDGNEMIYWKGTRLSSGNKQTTISDVDRTQSGDDFSYIRNYKGWWQISADGSEWQDVKETDQIVVYYLQKTTVTEEIETQVVDWGVVPHTDYTDGTASGKQSFVLVDYAVKYQSGDRSPDSFPTKKTQAFHCDSNSSTVQYDSSARAYYRHIGMIRAQETSDYEVYMITLTPSSDNAGTKVASYTSQATSYSYDGTEKVVWVDDEKDLGNFADSSTHHKDYSVGGDPIVSGLDVYNQQGMLVTYYVRAKVTQDSLKVHYIDKATGDEFYNYGIVVNSGTTFDANIALQEGDAWKGNLNNGTVTNSIGKEQTVSADLSTMPEIGAQYRYSNYKCDEVTRGEDGKDVYLYYTFNNSHSFVADFGEPITISAADLGVDGNSYTWDSSKITGETYGKVTLDKTNHTLTYTPNQILKNVDTMQLTLTDSSTKSSATHNIYIYPASNVMYEENFVKLGDTSDWTTIGTAGTSTQATEKLGEEGIHGYDDSYATDSTFSNGSAYQAQLTIPSEKDFTETDKTTFTFTGTGFDLISECGKDTGMLLAVVKDANGTPVKSYLVDTYFTGDEEGIISGTDILDYQVPVVRCMGLTQATYTVDVYGYLTNGSGAVKNAAKSAEATTAEGEVSEETVAEVLDDMSVKNVEASEVEATCMDDNSVLLGGTGVEETAAKSRSARAAATTTSANVYIDGVRVYNTLNDKNGAKNYVKSEQNVKYESVYDYVKNSLDENEDDAAVYVEYDGDQDVWNIADYKQQGPENEVYLTPGHSIVIALDGYSKDKTVQIAAKAIKEQVSCSGLRENSLSTATEMYYTAEVVEGDDGSAYVQITNNESSKGVLALSEMKVSSGINAIADPGLATMVLDKLNHNAEFVPETLTVSAPETLAQNRLSTLSVKASASDVEDVYLSIDNGKAKKLKANNSKAVKRGKSKTYSYSVAINPDYDLHVGEHTYSVYAVSKDGEKKSDPVVAKVQVTAED